MLINNFVWPLLSEEPW